MIPHHVHRYHGITHHAYNVKLNISLAENGTLHLGRQEGFAA